jgi:hypothetical protein
MGLEDDLVAAVENGTVLDLAGAGRPDRAEMDRWGPDRTIEASLLRDVLLGRKAPNADPHGVQLRGVRISGPLDLYNIQSDLDLSLSDCLIKDGVTLRRARLRMVSFTDCVILPGADGTCLDGHQLAAAALSLENSTFDAGDADSSIDLRDAQIDGPLYLSGARLNGHDSDGESLIGDGLTVGGDMVLSTSGRSVFSAAGAIRLPGAKIHGQLELSGAQLNGCNSDGYSLIGHGLAIDGDMFLRASGDSTFAAAGAVLLQGAHIHGALDLSAAQLNGRNSDGSLIGDQLTVRGGMFFRSSGQAPFTAAGTVRLPRAHR